VRKRDFAGTGHDAAADEAGVGDGVMRGAERPLSHEALRGIEYAGDRVNLGGLESFFEAKRSEDGWQPLGEHCFAGAGRTDH